MEHIYKTRIKTFTGYSLDALEHDINKFCDYNDAVSTDISVSYEPQAGKMLFERNSDSSYAEKYLAVVTYRVDWTEEMVQNGVEQWALARIDAKSIPRTWVDPVTLMEQSRAEIIKRKWDELLATDEAKALRKELEIKYSKEEK